MRDVGLTFPLYITVRNSGDALVTIAAHRFIHRIPTGSKHQRKSVGPSKRGLAAIGCEDGNLPALLRGDQRSRRDCRLVQPCRRSSISFCFPGRRINEQSSPGSIIAPDALQLFEDGRHIVGGQCVDFRVGEFVQMHVSLLEGFIMLLAEPRLRDYVLLRS